jgi:hypothetical protein
MCVYSIKPERFFSFSLLFKSIITVCLAPIYLSYLRLTEFLVFELDVIKEFWNALTWYFIKYFCPIPVLSPFSAPVIPVVV